MPTTEKPALCAVLKKPSVTMEARFSMATMQQLWGAAQSVEQAAMKLCMPGVVPPCRAGQVV